MQAINRQMTHYPNHIGQITFLAKHFRSSEWNTLSIPRNKSLDFNQDLEARKPASGAEQRFDPVGFTALRLDAVASQQSSNIFSGCSFEQGWLYGVCCDALSIRTQRTNMRIEGMSKSKASLFVRLAFNEAQLVELTTAIAWENYRARFNHSFGLQAQGFSGGAYCPLPE